ncbi:hypothetical protein C5167_002385 [Papaver somniferum]|uniref:Uncharacterized protein n=1 Tax=Papaver somniferum TaxID=3469 RepID=A0A4Y7L1H2_PAPSO|nr:hypothetical protein C5167_002385 [Papaver somniferum]
MLNVECAVRPPANSSESLMRQQLLLYVHSIYSLLLWYYTGMSFLILPSLSFTDFVIALYAALCLAFSIGEKSSSFFPDSHSNLSTRAIKMDSRNGKALLPDICKAGSTREQLLPLASEIHLLKKRLRELSTNSSRWSAWWPEIKRD